MPPLCGEGTMMTSRAHWSLTKPQITSSWQFSFANFSTESLYVLIFPNKFGNTDLYTIFEYWFQVCSCILCLMLNPKQCTSESWIWSVGSKPKDSDINSELQKFISQKIRFELCARKVLQRHCEDKPRSRSLFKQSMCRILSIWSMPVMLEMGLRWGRVGLERD